MFVLWIQSTIQPTGPGEPHLADRPLEGRYLEGLDPVRPVTTAPSFISSPQHGLDVSHFEMLSPHGAARIPSAACNWATIKKRHNNGRTSTEPAVDCEAVLPPAVPVFCLRSDLASSIDDLITTLGHHHQSYLASFFEFIECISLLSILPIVLLSQRRRNEQ
ncbi:uncharacterized protein B0T15DRAFT_178067 [Chaetomium strumarium]|uniref:Uncharacterized protein n=1 Tax=Chaetomium strumarium TaxID=1170767 RepID=A0AAJ0GWH8_9PEZI|nr:hypothetical protein B0T15DRAFT_178067 [Chaetomium strumarium]